MGKRGVGIGMRGAGAGARALTLSTGAVALPPPFAVEGPCVGSDFVDAFYAGDEF